jgi:carbonic anhydrase
MFLMLSSILPLSVLAFEKPSQHTSTQETSTKDLHAHWDYLGVESPGHGGVLSKEYMGIVNLTA